MIDYKTIKKYIGKKIINNNNLEIRKNYGVDKYNK